MSEQDDKAADVTGAFSALTLGFNLNRRQQALLLRVGWVLIVTTHILWACGWLGVIGLIGFARADELSKLQTTVSASARVTLSQEIRAQNRVRCASPDQAVKDSITRYIDSLQAEYEKIAGQRYPEPPCTSS
ncbi:MAG TPA: hypothetical protein VIW26_16640 [Gemmatimonadales bacterium]